MTKERRFRDGERERVKKREDSEMVKDTERERERERKIKRVTKERRFRDDEERGGEKVIERNKRKREQMNAKKTLSR